jgi:hypothetical protein
MENREVVDIIAEATNKKWFDEKKIEINYVIIKKKINFDSIIAFYNYVCNQVKLKSQINDIVELPLEINNIVSNFETLQKKLIDFINEHYQVDENALEAEWNNQIRNNILKISNSIPLDSILFISLIELSKTNLTSFKSAYNYAFNNKVTQSGSGMFSKEALDGILDINSLIKGEQLYSKVAEIKTIELEKLSNQFENTIAKSEVKYTDYIANTGYKYKQYTNEIDEYKTTKQTEVNTWLEETKTGFSTFDETSKSKIEDLEKTYAEKLKLSAPAQYWKARSEKLYKEGQTAMFWLIGLVGVACILLYILLWQTPEGMLTSIFNGDRSKAIRWSIVFITFISFLAVGFRMLSKIMFSAFHLSRDAEEREQLSYFYLALIKEGVVEKEDRHLIMQSLFSRADSGLLKEDSSPTMPSGMFEKIIQK